MFIIVIGHRVDDRTLAIWIKGQMRVARYKTWSRDPLTKVQLHPEPLVQAEQLLAHFEKLEAQFQLLRDGLTHSHRLATIGTIASMVAHEYNNILTPILSYAQMALSKPDDHELMKRAVQKAMIGAERAAQISSSMLGFSRENDGRKVAELRSAIDDAVACLGREPHKDGIKLTIEVPAVAVTMSPLNLQQVFVNLILNAKQAMRRGGGALSITGRIEKSEVVIAVADTGPGIPSEIMDRLFEPFVTTRCGEPHDGEPKGTGLGLCICRDLMRSAGGEITVTTAPGQGATFHLRMALAEELIETT